SSKDQPQRRYPERGAGRADEKQPVGPALRSFRYAIVDQNSTPRFVLKAAMSGLECLSAVSLHFLVRQQTRFAATSKS
ncbi:hypothetical protein ABUE31_15830, partial [Mesorhizobium sp. ZMM04-5]